jgi:hypothetical protein
MVDGSHSTRGRGSPVSAGRGGNAGQGPSFTWKASSAAFREIVSEASSLVDPTIKAPRP